MKIEVYGSEKNDDIVRLRLRSNVDGGVTLMVVNKDGRRIPRGDLLTFHQSSGKVLFAPAISSEFGFLLDRRGRLVKD